MTLNHNDYFLNISPEYSILMNQTNVSYYNLFKNIRKEPRRDF